jgi:hypothetical protein
VHVAAAGLQQAPPWHVPLQHWVGAEQVIPSVEQHTPW